MGTLAIEIEDELLQQQLIGTFTDGDQSTRAAASGWRWVAPTLCLVTGVISAYSFKVMNMQSFPRCSSSSPSEDCSAAPFNGPFLQSLLMFIAEIGCFFVWALQPSDRKVKGAWWHWVAPAAMDCGGTTLCNIAYALTYASTVQMLRNFLVVVCALLQIVVVKRSLRGNEWLGVFAITAAMFLAATPALLTPDESSADPTRTWVGIIFALVGTSLSAVQIIFEEWLFLKAPYPPMKAVGMEGLSGAVLIGAMLPMAHWLRLENVRGGAFQIFYSPTLRGISCFYMLAAMTFNASGLLTTKLSGGLLRAVIFAIRAPIVWALDLYLGWISFDFYNLTATSVFIVGFLLYSNATPFHKNKQPALE